MLVSHYWSLHIATGVRQTGRVTTKDFTDFLILLDKWNAELPGLWQYWSA